MFDKKAYVKDRILNKLEKMSEYSRIYNEYLKDLTYTKVMVPLDLTKETDMAYLRVMHKRQLRRMKCQ